MSVTAMNFYNFDPFDPFNGIDLVKKTATKATIIGLSTTLIAGIHAQSISTEPTTTESFIEAAAKDQCLNTDRADLKMLARIRCIGSYTDSWDNADGKSASRQAVNEAEQFAWQLPPDIKEPTITLAADGEINFLWVFSEFKLDLGIYGDGSYSYYGKAADGTEFLADEVMISEKLPSEILAIITNNNIH